MATRRKDRYHLLDMLRGICIILVVIYHAMYNLTAIFSVDLRLFGTVVMDSFRMCFVVCLVIISGISCSLNQTIQTRIRFWKKNFPLSFVKILVNPTGFTAFFPRISKITLLTKLVDLKGAIF